VASLVRNDIWNEQVRDVIEFYAAWIPLTLPYKDARHRVMHLLAGRKACRDFRPATGHAGVPKSSLDGMRESVWKNPKSTPDLNRALERRLRLSDGEQLDVVGLTKRLGGGKKGYPSVSRIAADPWLRGGAKSPKNQDDFAALKAQCETLVPKGITRVDWPQFNDFPYEGTAVYRNRHKELAQETAQDEAVYRDLTDIVRRLEKRLAVPEPYLAVLVADGDRMGKTIATIKSVVKHREFSRQLATFAGAAREIVEKHHGCLVYSGGDDVLAFVPVDQCLDCARALHDKFAELMVSWKDDKGIPPTLSVGLAIGHFMEPLEDLLEYSRVAEKAAKNPDRNGLAVHLHTRGGVPIQIRESWSADMDVRLKKWAEMHRKEQIADKVAYDLRELTRQYEGWPNKTKEEKETLAAALKSDALRLMTLKTGKQGDAGLTEVKTLLENVRSAEDTLTIAKEIILARRIAAAEQQAAGRTINGIQEVSG
jgi:CRISPR-associated protein Cmr2